MDLGCSNLSENPSTTDRGPPTYRCPILHISWKYKPSRPIGDHPLWPCPLGVVSNLSATHMKGLLHQTIKLSGFRFLWRSNYLSQSLALVFIFSYFLTVFQEYFKTIRFFMLLPRSQEPATWMGLVRRELAVAWCMPSLGPWWGLRA